MSHESHNDDPKDSAALNNSADGGSEPSFSLSVHLSLIVSTTATTTPFLLLLLLLLARALPHRGGRLQVVAGGLAQRLRDAGGEAVGESAARNDLVRVAADHQARALGQPRRAADRRHEAAGQGVGGPAVG